jgi:HAD superfamily phosphoserine phosphatase-like hydrolase
LTTTNAFLCDFDGTVSPADVGAALVGRFARPDPAEHRAALAGWKSGALGHRALTEAECGWMRVHADEALDFTRTFAIDPHFAAFVREVEARGDVVMVVSEGFDFYVGDQLVRAGVGHLKRAANSVRFEGDRVIPEFPFIDPACPRCGNCKAQHVRRYRARGYRTVFVGDGLSDRCGAREADRVFARRDLLTWCERERIAATPFDDFADVASAVRRDDAGRPLVAPASAIAPARPGAS